MSEPCSVDVHCMATHPRADLPSLACGQTHKHSAEVQLWFLAATKEGGGVLWHPQPWPAQIAMQILCIRFTFSSGVPWVPRHHCPSQALRGQGVELAAQPCSWGRKREWGAGRPQPGARLVEREREGGAAGTCAFRPCWPLGPGLAPGMDLVGPDIFNRDPRDHYDLLQRLGGGTYGEVFKVRSFSLQPRTQGASAGGPGRGAQHLAWDAKKKFSCPTPA